MENNTLSIEQLQEQAAIAERLAAAGLPVLTAEKLGQYREAGNKKRLAAIGRMSSAGFIAGLSTAGRLVAPAASEPAGRPRVVVVDRWNGSRWIEVTLHWNGAEYAAPACVNCKAAPARLDSIYCGDACRRAFLTF